MFDLPNRRAWQPILHSNTVQIFLEDAGLKKLKGLGSAQRLGRQITAFYGDPGTRWDGWDLYCSFGGKPPAVGDSGMVPSLEHAALERYDPDFLGREFDFDQVERAVSDILGFRHSCRLPNLLEPALALWPALRRDLLRWSEVPPARHQALVLATFSVASILDDVRLLQWASERSERLAEEFAFALRDAPENPSQSAISDACEAPGEQPGPVGVLEEWNRECARIIDIASELKSGSPDPRRLDDLLLPVRRLEALQGEIADAVTLRDRRQLVGRVAEILAECAQDWGAAWLAGIGGQVHALWQLAYCPPSDAAEADVRQDLQRLESWLPQEVGKWLLNDN